ncbi:MAG: (d)CMP kinase [Verrucomicrobia bacterium]|nr:(d)CMP kinase [Verrucomicrobiota bacterium]
MNKADTSSSTVVIAIDGPAASGKSTVARALAAHLGYRFLNSGDLYRAITWGCLSHGVDCRDTGAVAMAVGNSHVEVGCDGTEYYPIVDGTDPRVHLRHAAVNANVSPVSAVPAVRYILSAAIRAHAQGRRTVVEGRDIGSAVFPETPYKFYIDAPAQVRQRRRRNQGQTEEIAKRDLIDSTRSTDPLTIAPGATVIDSSTLDVEGVVAAMVEKLRAQGLVFDRTRR